MVSNILKNEVELQELRYDGKEENEKTARYAEYNSTGEGAAAAGRVKWAKQLTKKEAAQYDDLNYIYRMCSDWKPEN